MTASLDDDKNEIIAVLLLKCSLRLCIVPTWHICRSQLGTIGWMNPAGDSVSASEFDTEFPVPCACVLIIIALYCGSNFSAQAISHASNSKF